MGDPIIDCQIQQAVKEEVAKKAKKTAKRHFKSPKNHKKVCM